MILHGVATLLREEATHRHRRWTKPELQFGHIPRPIVSTLLCKSYPDDTYEVTLLLCLCCVSCVAYVV